MKSIHVRLPNAVHGRVKELAAEAEVSLNQFILIAVSNEVVRQETRDFFRTAASQFDPAAFAEALGAVPDAPPAKGDRMPSQ